MVGALRCGAGVGVAGAVACATVAPASPPPVFSVRSDEAGPHGQNCGQRPTPNRGPRPPDTRLIASLVVGADQPVSLDALEQVILVHALRRCATGISVLRASATPGADGFVDATAELWDEESGGDATDGAPHVGPTPPADDER
jgi:hypothetical protein